MSASAVKMNIENASSHSDIGTDILQLRHRPHGSHHGRSTLRPCRSLRSRTTGRRCTRRGQRPRRPGPCRHRGRARRPATRRYATLCAGQRSSPVPAPSPDPPSTRTPLFSGRFAENCEMLLYRCHFWPAGAVPRSRGEDLIIAAGCAGVKATPRRTTAGLETALSGRLRPVSRTLSVK